MSEPVAPLPHPYADLLGFTITTKGAGKSTAVLEISEKHMNPNQVVHGGAIYSLVDTSMGAALMSGLEAGKLCSTIEIKINYFRPAVSGTITCHTEVVHQGSKTAAMDSVVKDQNGKMLARATGTFMIFETEAAFRKK